MAAFHWVTPGFSAFSTSTGAIMTKGFVVGAVSSGSGKTTISIGLMAALARRGYTVAPFKVGPDFIDPGHHRQILGVPSRNLDGWMLSQAYNRQLFARRASGGAVAVVEGVMGLYDGAAGDSEAGSTAEMAKWLDLPVLLVVDAGRMARSAAAVIRGFETFDPGLRFLGVVFNRVGSQRHFEHLQAALAGHVTTPCLGALPKDADLGIPERHLGLMTAEDHPLKASAVDHLVQMIENHLDVKSLAQRLELRLSHAVQTTPSTVIASGSPRIGVARDNAFCFYYPENLELLEESGARLVYFSPLADKSLPGELDGLYFGGGYPEVYAVDLAANAAMRSAVRALSRAGMPIYAECGGFMYLCGALSDIAGQLHPMCGIYPFDTLMLERRRALGYREVVFSEGNILGEAGTKARGHEFHYSSLALQNPGCGVETCYRVISRSDGQPELEGYRVGNTLGSYVHLHFGSNPDLARHWVEKCKRYNMERRLT
jgi:cobyrinic acid a,c-diamide synthase